MEISFPPPAGAAPATIAHAAAPGAGPGLPPPTAPRSLGGGAALARATRRRLLAAARATDSVVDAVLRALREENEHIGILDGIDPLI